MKDLPDYFSRICPERFFLLAAGIFGILILVLTPPFQVPDEPNHFFKAWQISDGVFISLKQDQRVGGNLPTSFHGVVVPFERIIWSRRNKFSVVGSDEVIHILPDSAKRFYDFNNTALYSPVCYIPQAFVLFLLKPVQMPVVYYFYAARLFSFFIWLLIIYISIKRIPIYKWLFTLLTLLPMSLFINMSLSADLMTNALCFLFISTVLKLRCQEGPLSRRQTLFLSLLALLVASVKIVYTPLLLLVFIIPKNKFRSQRDYFFRIGAVLCAAALVIFFWSNLISRLYTPYEEYNPAHREHAAVAYMANMHSQLNYLKADPGRVFSVLLHSLRDCSLSHVEGYIGLFGWMDTKLNPWVQWTLYLVILFVAAGENNKAYYQINFKQKLIFAGVFVLILSLLFLSQYLSWVLVGEPSVSYIHGRYFIPFYPLFFFLLYGLLPWKKLTAPLVIMTVIPSLAYTVFVLYSRYVAEPG